MEENEQSRGVMMTEAQRFRAVLEAESRTTTLVRLFDYLLEHSADARAPKEIEIALAVFGKTSGFDTSQDSMVRVQVHRLRTRLGSFYLGMSGPRLVIPKGEYRILLSDGPPSLKEASPETHSGRRFWSITAAIVALNAVLWTGFFLRHHNAEVSPGTSSSAFWRPVADAKRPPLIVVGDSYSMVQSDNGRDVRRMIMLTNIQSEMDLDRYIAKRPGGYQQLHNLYVNYMSTNTAVALWPMLSNISDMRADKSAPEVMPASRLSPQTLNRNDILYIGRIDEMSVLRSLLSDVSSLEFDTPSGVVADRKSGRKFTPKSDELLGGDAGSGDGKASGVDYGYVASFPGSSGKKIFIIAGVQDIAFPQMVKLLSDTKYLEQLARQTRNSPAFEALYQVASYGNLRFDTKLLIARPMH